MTDERTSKERGFGRPCVVCGRSRYDHSKRSLDNPTGCSLRLVSNTQAGRLIDADSPFPRTRSNPVRWLHEDSALARGQRLP